MPDRFISRESLRIKFFPVREYITWPRVGITTVAVLGAAMHIFDAAIGAHASVRLSDSGINGTIGASFGSTNASRESVAPYLTRRIEGVEDDNDSILVAPRFKVFGIEGFAIGSIGNVPEVPSVDIGYRFMQSR